MRYRELACVLACMFADSTIRQSLKAYFGESETCTVHSFFGLLGKLIAVGVNRHLASHSAHARLTLCRPRGIFRD